MKINSIYITILLIVILILLIIYCCYYYNSENNIENYTTLSCTNYRDGNYCKQIGEENPFWCFIKKIFCFIIYLKNQITIYLKNQITTKDEVIKTKDTHYVNLEDEVKLLDKRIVELNSTIETIQDAIKKSDSDNAVFGDTLIESEKKRVELEKVRSQHEIRKNWLLKEINDLKYSSSDNSEIPPGDEDSEERTGQPGDSSCEEGYYESISKTATSHRQCTPLHECDVGTFVTNIERTITEDRQCSPCPDGSEVKVKNLKAMPNCGDAYANYYKVGNDYNACPAGTTSNPGATSINDCVSSGIGIIYPVPDPTPVPDPPAPDPPVPDPPAPDPPVPDPPVPDPPVSDPPVSEPPVPEPPVPDPPVSEPPVSDPPVPDPPVSDPPVSEPPVSDPPVSEPPVSEPPVSDPPASDPTDPSGNILPTEEETLIFEENCIEKCHKNMCPDSQEDCISSNEQTCIESCNQHNEFTLLKCPEFDCKDDEIIYRIQSKYNTKMASLLNADEVSMNFPKRKIHNTDTELNCNVEYNYSIYHRDDSEESGSNTRNFGFEKNDLDCTYTLLNMSMGSMSEDSSDATAETRIGSINFVLPNTNRIRDQVSDSRTGKSEAARIL